jgi:carbon starvation protein
MRNKGRSIGDLTRELVNPRVQTLFLLVIFFLLLLVIAVFALIIAILFNSYPVSVIPVWLQIVIAVGLGYLIYKKGMDHRTLGLAAVALMYLTIVWGAYQPIALGENGILIWMVILFIYAFVASTLPVQTLLQPRDYINGHQLLVAMGLLFLGAAVAQPEIVAPAVNPSPEGAPPIWPFLFIIIACGAISGFHALASSGVSSKQCQNEGDAQFVGYGSMLVEGSLSTLVIVACVAGIGMGLEMTDGALVTGVDAFNQHYASWSSASGLAKNLKAFIEGSANMMETLGIPREILLAIMAVFLVSFAGTTLDSATRIQRYVVSELARSWKVDALAGRYSATAFAVLTAAGLAFYDGSGKGALTLWPLFGCLNQLLAGLALLVLTVYLVRRRTPVYVTAIPMVFMLFMTGWAMVENLATYFETGNWLLFAIGAIVVFLEIWMIVECAILLRHVAAERLEPKAAAQA